MTRRSAVYKVRVESLHTGEVRFINQYVKSRRKARKQARVLLRYNGMTGRLKVSIMHHPAPGEERNSLAMAEKDGRVIYGAYTYIGEGYSRKYVQCIEPSKRQLKDFARYPS